MIEYPSDEGVVSAMASLKGNSDFIRITNWLIEERESVAHRAMTMSGTEVERMQGAYMAMKTLIKTIEDSREVLESRQERRRSRAKTRIP